MKDLQGYEGLYKVTTTGKIYSHYSNKFLALKTTAKGYVSVCLFNPNLKGNPRKYPMVHRLVALTHIPNPNNLPQINHIDGNKLNNNVCNLEWCTPSQNVQHAIDTGLLKIGMPNKDKKLTNTTSKYFNVTCMGKPESRDGVYYRAQVKLTVAKVRFTKTKQFSIKVHGELEAERLAALAVNTMIDSYPEFSHLRKNDVDSSLTTSPKGRTPQAIGGGNGKGLCNGVQEIV